jgi:hypothetical protein
MTISPQGGRPWLMQENGLKRKSGKKMISP